jgi:hypothetical protein
MCPNKALPEWKALVELTGSEFEAYRAYLENNMDIPELGVIKEKLANKNKVKSSEKPVDARYMSESINDIMEADQPVQIQIDAATSDNVRGLEIAKKMAKQLNLDYETITRDQAIEMTLNADMPYSQMEEQARATNQKAPAGLFFNGKVYFIGENLSAQTAVHEFSHPLIRAIQKSNEKLFNNLYNTLLKENPALVTKLQSQRPDLKPGSDLFKEEALVMALTDAAIRMQNNEKLQPGFKKFITDLMYALKQMLRKIFGDKIPISKMDPMTSLNDIAEALAMGQNFTYEKDLVTQDNVASYMTDINDYMADIEKVDGKYIHDFLNKASFLVESAEKMLQSEKFDELQQTLIDEFGRSDLKDLKGDIKEYRSTLKKIAEGVIRDSTDTIKASKAFAKTLTQLQTIMQKTLTHMQQIADSERDSIDSMQRFFYYERFVNYWDGFITEIEATIKDRKRMGFRIDQDSPLLKLVTSISGTIASIREESNAVRADGARDALYAELEPMGRDIKEKYEGIISSLKAANAPQSQIDKWFIEYHGMNESDYAEFDQLRKKVKNKTGLTVSEELKYDQLLLKNKDGVEISPEKIEGLLKGKLGDAGWLNSFLEGYLYNNDAVIAGMALYVKNGLNEVMVKSQAKFNDFAEDMKADLEKIGYNPSNIGELGEKVGFKDLIGFIDENGVVQQKEVWTMLNRFKNYRLTQTQLTNERNIAEKDYAEMRNEETRLRYLQANQALKEFNRNYMYNDYVREVYAADELLEKDDIGKEAAYKRQVAFDAMNTASEKIATESDTKDAEEEMKLALRTYRQLYSMTYLNGKAKTGNDKLIAERLLEHRDLSRQYWEWKPRKGAFEKSLANYENELEAAKYERGSEAFKKLRSAWIEKNTRRVISNEWYTRRSQLLERKKEILKKLPDSDRKEVDNTKITEDILNYTEGFRDESNEIQANELDPKVVAEIKKLEEQALAKSQNYVRKSGLTTEQHERLSQLYAKKASERLTSDEMSEWKDLRAMKSMYGLNEFEITELDSINEELEGLSDYTATEYYVDIMDDLLKKVDPTVLKEATGSNTITKQTANELLNDEVINKLLGQSPEFDKWFNENHIKYSYYDKTQERDVTVYRRLRIWSVSTPSDPRFYEKTEIRDQFGNIKETIPGLPKLDFYSRQVKKEYRTGYNQATGTVEKVVGLHINNKNEWLPRTVEDGAKDSTYINEKYDEMRDSNPDLFKVLEKLTKHHLDNQADAPYKSKLYLDFPRFPKSRLELVQSPNFITNIIQRIKGFLGRADDFEDGLNYKDKWNLVRADMFDDEIADVPIRGLYNLDIDDVSTDITFGMMRYMFSMETQKQLIKMSPFVRSLQDVVSDPKNKVIDPTKVNKWSLTNLGIVNYINKDGLSVRKRAVDNFIEREFEGKRLTGFGSDVPWLTNASNAMFKAASFQFFALNIPSALKNSLGAKFQSMIEAAAGKYYTVGDWQRGNMWSYKAMADMSRPANMYAKGAKTLDQQIMEIFDPSQGRFAEKFGESMSRSLLQDTVSGSWLYSFRKWTELQATMQIFGGMMYHKKVTQFKGTAEEKEINYIDAWELNKDNKIQLKEGIDPELGVTYDKDGSIKVGKDFKSYKNKIQGVMNNLQGAYSEFDQPEAQRYLAFRYISFLRKYLTPMLINRWGHAGSIFKGTVRPRLNAALGEGHTGYYIRTLQVIKETVKEMGRNLPFLQAEEKAAVIRTLTEVMALIVLYFGANALFGYDPDDEDRYKKLRAKSGPLPMFGTDENNDPFKFGGWASNHMLLLMTNVRAENQQFIPLPGLGLKEYTSMLDLKSVAFGPTVSSYVDILDNLLAAASGSEKAYYAKDSGPYTWQKEGDLKIKNMLGKMVGLNGSSVDPAMGLKNLNSVLARK